VRMAREHVVMVARDAALVEVCERPDQHLSGLLWPVALSAAGLLCRVTPQRLKKCPGPRCGWLFLDATKNGRRQWCSMADCGNRSKVTRYRARRGKTARRQT
jgi:predicted RNA-binding Zn ribbon-like protein